MYSTFEKYKNWQEQSLLLILPDCCLLDSQKCLLYVLPVSDDDLRKVSVGDGRAGRSVVAQTSQEEQVEGRMYA